MKLNSHLNHFKLYNNSLPTAQKGINMDKRYQIFISSTFEDLKEERQEVLKAVLELDHIPAGMELFPATDESAWELIKEVIDNSDYYIVIVGGRYGSMDEEGIGFTEKEYDYAAESSKPVVALLHKNPDNLKRKQTETDSAVWKKLCGFREKIKAKHTCAYWESSKELKAEVITSLSKITKRKPGTGWARADQLQTEESLKELIKLRSENEKLKSIIETQKTTPPKGTEDLIQGNEVVEYLYFTELLTHDEDIETYQYEGSAKISIDEVWAYISPELINESRDYIVRKRLLSCLQNTAEEYFDKTDQKNNILTKNFHISSETIDTFVIQFRALGLMMESVKKRGIKDTHTYWALTPYGDYLMTKLRAIKRPAPKE